MRNFEARRSATPGFDPAGRRGGWELYDMQADRTELTDLASRHTERVAAMAEAYQRWADRCGVIDRQKVLEIHRRRR